MAIHQPPTLSRLAVATPFGFAATHDMPPTIGRLPRRSLAVGGRIEHGHRNRKVVESSVGGARPGLCQSGPIVGTALAQLDGTGIVGMGLAVGPLRRPFAAEAPLLGPEDWQGTRFRVYNSPVQSDAVTAFGAEPVDLSFERI